MAPPTLVMKYASKAIFSHFLILAINDQQVALLIKPEDSYFIKIIMKLNLHVF